MKNIWTLFETKKEKEDKKTSKLKKKKINTQKYSMLNT